MADQSQAVETTSNKSNNRIAKDEDFALIENSNAAKNWRVLGRRLDIPDYQLDVIADDYLGLTEKCHQTLRKWSDVKAINATVAALIEALKDIDHTAVAEKLQTKLIEGFDNK